MTPPAELLSAVGYTHFPTGHVTLFRIKGVGVVLALLVGAADAQEPQSPNDVSDPPTTLDVFLRTNTNFFTDQLDFQNRQTDKELFLLRDQARFDGPAVFVGGQARLSAIAGATNTENKYNYLGRFPPDFEGKSVTDARMLQANAAFAGHVNDWISVYGELLFSDVFSFPDHKQGSLQVRQAYAVFGDLSESPFYGFAGKKNVSFGDMGTLSPFSQSVVWHYFGALHEGAGIGYDDGDFNFTLSALNGGRGLRVSDSEAKGKLNNFAVNALYRSDSDWVQWQVGAGFLLGTIYDATEAEHLDPTAFGEYNHAWDVNGEMRVGPVTVAAEIASTTGDWPTTGHPVIAYRTEAAYDCCVAECPARLSVSWSEGIQGASGTEFEFNQQLVLGLSVTPDPHVRLSFEYIRSLGFAPLIGITTVSDRHVVQNTALAGMTLVF